jgi:hypothetical protein
MGLLLHAIVHSADIQDRDGGYRGRNSRKLSRKSYPHLETEIVKRSDQVKGFVVLPKRWIVHSPKSKCPSSPTLRRTGIGLIFSDVFV